MCEGRSRDGMCGWVGGGCCQVDLVTGMRIREGGWGGRREGKVERMEEKEVGRVVGWMEEVGKSENEKKRERE